MEKKSNILVKTEKSNRSENKVWVVKAPGFEDKYCRNALMALRYAFFLKKGTGCRIADKSFKKMIASVRARKSQTTIEEPAQC